MEQENKLKHAFIEQNENEIVIETDKIRTVQTKDGISIEAVEGNHTFDELKQKLINYLYNTKSYEEIDVEIMKLLFK